MIIYIKIEDQDKLTHLKRAEMKASPGKVKLGRPAYAKLDKSPLIFPPFGEDTLDDAVYYVYDDPRLVEADKTELEKTVKVETRDEVDTPVKKVIR